MTDFNPQFQTQTPYYLHMSKSIQQPYSPSEGDKSTGILLKTAGEGLEEGTKLVDTGIKDSIKNEEEDFIRSRRDEFIGQLDTLLNNKAGNPPLNARAEAADQDLMPDKGADAPASVSRGLSAIERIQNAKDQGGKFRTTSLDAEVNNTLKDLRAKWPGYRDYIDQEASRILGYNPANKLVSDKLAQLNELTTNKQKEQEYWERQVVSSGFSGSQRVLQQFRATGDISAVENWLAKNNEERERITQATARFNLADKSRSYHQNVAEDAAYKAADHATTEYFTNKRIIDVQGRTLGVDPGTSASELSDRLFKMSQNPTPESKEEARVIGTQLEGLRQRNAMLLENYYKTTKDKDGRSLWEVLGPKRANEIIDETNNRFFRTQQKLLTDDNLGLVHATQNAVGDIKNNDALNVLKDNSTSAVARAATALNTLAPNLSPDLTKQVWGDMPDYSKKLLNLMTRQKWNAITQQGGDTTDGYTFKQFQVEQDKAADIAHATEQERAEAAKKFIEFRRAFNEKDPRVVDAAINTFFAPSNTGTLDKYMDDYYDNTTGKIKTGRTEAYRSLTAPDVTKAVWKRAHEGNGPAWDNYKTWADNTAAKSLMTMAKTWNVNEEAYKNNQVLHTLEGDMPTHTDHHFYWDSDKHQIGVTDHKGNILDLNSLARVSPDMFAVRNANIMLGNLAHVYEQEGTDVNAALFRTMQRAGWSPESVDVKGSPIPQRIIKSVIISSQKPEKKE